MIGSSCPALTHNRRRTRPGAGEVLLPSEEQYDGLLFRIGAGGARRLSSAEEGEGRRQATGAGEVFLPREEYNNNLCGELVTLDQLPSKVS